MSSHCPSCGADVEGQWRTCPLCRIGLEQEQGSETPESYPAVPLRFHRRKLRRLLLVLSVAVVVASFPVQLAIPDLFGPIRTVWLSVATLWLVVLATANRRRNVGSLVVWLVLLLSLAAAAWDLVTGGPAWATTWAIPAICTSANLALGIVIWVVRLDPAEHVAKLALVLFFGLVPGLFVIFGWVSVALPSLICVAFSLVLLTLTIVLKRRELGGALHRRLQV